MNILLVDDSPVIRSALRNALGEHHDADTFKIFTAEDGRAALRIIKNQYIDLMFLDWNMPIMNGEELVNSLRESKRFDQLRIIMATTEASKGQVMKMAKKGINAYLVKPFDKEGVLKAFNTVAARMH